VNGGIFSRASLLTEGELVLGLLVIAWMMGGVALAWSGRRAAHVAAMKALPPLMALFLVVFVAGALTRGGVEALGDGARQALLALLILHVVLSLAGGLLLVHVLRQGWRAAGSDPVRAAAALGRHRRWAGFTAGFWLVNGLLGVLVFLLAYVV
jgi:uncharacterized membrane protein YozB (DUF420 family)